MKVKSILISQPNPTIENSPYLQLKSKRKVKIDFIPFIHVEGMTAREVRFQKIDLSKFSAIITFIQITLIITPKYHPACLSASNTE